MLWLIQRALGPAVAIYLPSGVLSFLSERSQHQLASNLLLNKTNYYRQVVSQFVQRHRLQQRLQSTMSVATVYDAMTTTSTSTSMLPLNKQLQQSLRFLQEDEDFSAISKATASHEEAVLLSLDDDEDDGTMTSSSSSSCCDDEDTDAQSMTSQQQSATTNTDANNNHSALWKSSLPEPIVVEGVALAATKNVTTASAVASSNNNNSDDANADTVLLHRNGHGLRTVRAPFGITINVYLATIYTPEPIRSAQDVDAILFAGSSNSSNEDKNNNNSPFVMEFTFLRNVTPSQMSIAWNYQLDTSVTTDSQEYEGYALDKAKFLQLLLEDGDGDDDEGSNNKSSSGMVDRGTIVLEFHVDHDTNDTKMVVVNQGQRVGEVVGSNFSKAFCSMWFGDRPVMEEIKQGLLHQDVDDDIVITTDSVLGVGDTTHQGPAIAVLA